MTTTKAKRRDPVTGRVLPQYVYAYRGKYRIQIWNSDTGKLDCAIADTWDDIKPTIARLMANRHIGLTNGGNSTTLDDYFRLWKSTKRIKENVLRNYIYMYEHYAAPVLGSKKIKQVKYSTILSFYRSLIDDMTLKVNTLDVLHLVLHQVFALAVRDDLIRTNPTEGAMKEIRATNTSDPKREFLDPEQQARFLSVLSRPEYVHWYPTFLFLLSTGLRCSEFCGLTDPDIDTAAGQIHIRRNLKYFPRLDTGRQGYQITTPKTKASTRDLPLSPYLLSIVEMQKRDGYTCNVTIDGVSGFIFCNAQHNPHNQNTLNRFLKRLISTANKEPGAVQLPPITCHSLRHTFASNLIRNGVSIPDAADLMGHSDTVTITRIYNHIITEQRQAAMDKANQALAVYLRPDPAKP